MVAVNTTGQHSANEYMVGRGILRVAELDANDVAGPFWDLGNVSEFTMSPEVEEIEHFSSRQGQKTLDRTDVISTSLNLSMVAENINQRTMSWFMMGTQATITNPAVAGFTGATLIADGKVSAGTFAIVKNAAGVRCFDLDATKVTVKTTAAVPVTLVKDTDYEVMVAEGMIKILSSAAITAVISANKGLTIDLAADAGALASFLKISGLTSSDRKFALSFIGEDPKTGAKTEYFYYKVPLRPNGDHALIGDEYKSVSLQGKAEILTGMTTPVDIYPITLAS